MNFLRVGLVQQRCGRNRQENIDKSLHGIRQAAVQGARLVVLQELQYINVAKTAKFLQK